ncbi:MAG: aminopeptidase P family N-terminal domain-containing protein, partial [Candidatus Puniceispirillum sp.]
MTGVATAEVLATRLAALRAALKAARLAGWIVGREDMYQGEEVPAGDERLAFIAGFTGSAGFAVVTADHAALFSDGRYSLQMAAQTDPAYWQSFTLPDDRLEAWLAGLDMPAAARFGIDGRLVTIDGFQRLERAILDAGGQLTSHPSNLIDQIWADRPALGPATPWPIADDVAGNSMATKLADLDAVLLAEPCDAVLLTRVDAVNWLINH